MSSDAGIPAETAGKVVAWWDDVGSWSWLRLDLRSNNLESAVIGERAIGQRGEQHCAISSQRYPSQCVLPRTFCQANRIHRAVSNAASLYHYDSPMNMHCIGCFQQFAEY